MRLNWVCWCRPQSIISKITPGIFEVFIRHGLEKGHSYIGKEWIEIDAIYYLKDKEVKVVNLLKIDPFPSELMGVIMNKNLDSIFEFSLGNVEIEKIEEEFDWINLKVEQFEHYGDTKSHYLYEGIIVMQTSGE